jgi:nucleoporin NUP159
LGFKALKNELIKIDVKVQLLPTPWPAGQLPSPTSSLLSVASKKGLVAAAGPDTVVVAYTKTVRHTFQATEEEIQSSASGIRPFQPELHLPMPMRISQVAFSADESYLVLSAEDGGGLAVYEVQGLLGGATQPAFQVSTNGQPIRALIPNPTQGELFAVVLANGSLLMANLMERNFVQGGNGQVLKDTVSCVSWSSKGKQLVAGLANGTAYQMKPDGSGVGDIPRPPSVNEGNFGK